MYFLQCIYKTLFIIIFIGNFLIAKYAVSNTQGIKVYGLHGDLKNKINIQLSNIIKNNNEDINKILNSANTVLQTGLKSFGYYNSKITFHYQKSNFSDNHTIIIHINPGEPIYVSKITIFFTGDGKFDKEYLQLINKKKILEGTILSHSNYEKFKNSFISLAINRGYFKAKMKQSKLIISLKHKKSFWYFYFDSGIRYRFGDLKYQGSQIQKNILDKIVPFKYKDFYNIEQLLKFNSLLVKTGWFDSVLVTPNITYALKHNLVMVPINVLLLPRVRNYIELGGGYSNDGGFRIKSAWNKPWINSKGQNFFSNISVSQLEQAIDASYKIFLQNNPIKNYYIIQSGYKHIFLNKLHSNTTTLNLLRTWNYYNKWQCTINLRWTLNHFFQNNQYNNSMLVYPGIHFNKFKRHDSNIIPYTGSSQKYGIDISSKKLGSKINFIILQTENIWIKAINEKDRYIIRSSLGIINTQDINSIPPDLRFFVGGSYIIRGYDYDQNNLLKNKTINVGASKRFILSSEYLHNINQNLWVSSFIDIGDVANNFNFKNIKIGSGFGLRWISPIGVIKLDCASPINQLSNSKKIKLHFGLGFDL